MLCFQVRPTLFREIASHALRIGDWLYSQSQSRHFRREKNTLPLPGLEAEFLDRPGHILGSITKRNKMGRWRNSVFDWAVYRRGARWFWSLKFLRPWTHLSATAPVIVILHTASIRFLPLYWKTCLNTNNILTLSMFIFLPLELHNFLQ